MKRDYTGWTLVFDLDGTLVETAPDLHGPIPANSTIFTPAKGPVAISLSVLFRLKKPPNQPDLKTPSRKEKPHPTSTRGTLVMYGEQSFDAPVIHVVSESPRLEMLQTRLRQAGIRPVPVRGSYLPPDSAPAFIDLVTRAFEFDTNDDRLFVTIGKQEQAPTASEIHLTDIAQIATLPARLSIRQREKQRKREIRLRAQTSEKFGAPVAGAIPSGQKSRVLWLGHELTSARAHPFIQYR